MSTKSESTRESLLIAANQVVTDYGASQLTLEAVAHAAGVSKGGLLYHFPSKEALIVGMIQHSVERFEERIEEIQASLPDLPGRWLRAFVEASFEDHDISPQVFVAITAAIANQPELLQPLQAQFTRWIEKAADDGVPPDIARLVITTTNGEWFERIFWQDSSNERLKQNLLGLIARSVST